MDKIKENFHKNKQIWILIGVVLVILLIVFGTSKYEALIKQKPLACQLNDFYDIYTGKLCPGKKIPGPCAPGILYNRETGKICPEDPAPYVDPKTIIPGKG